MDHILRMVYPEGKANISMGHFFPAGANKREKLLALIRESYEDPQELINQVVEYLREAIGRMETEAASAQARYKTYKQAARDEAVYKGAMNAAHKEYTVFENNKEKLIKEKEWWETHLTQ